MPRSTTLYVSFEISRRTWVVGIKDPASVRIGLHTLAAADMQELQVLIEWRRAKAERSLGGPVRVLCCYEAGYEGFWLARCLEQELSTETVIDARYPRRRPTPSGAERQISGRIPEFQPDLNCQASQSTPTPATRGCNV